jgi:hypothetical protein
MATRPILRPRWSQRSDLGMKGEKTLVTEQVYEQENRGPGRRKSGRI